MRRAVSNLVVFLIIVGITVAVGMFVSRVVISGVTPSHDKPNHLQVISKMASMVPPQALRIEVVFSNPTNRPFCVKLDRVAIYTTQTSPTETVSQISSSVVVAPGSSTNYEIVLRLSNVYQLRGIAVAYFNMYMCTDIQSCSCTGSVTYVEAIPIRF
ncbi:MAG: hypothetical protein QXU08_09725 [Ignisphaera sp.]